MLRLNLWTTWCILVGMFGQVAYLAAVLQPFLPAWVVVPIFILPIAAVVFIQPGEFPDRWVRRVHVGAAAWYVVITLTVEAVAIFGTIPDGALLFRVLMHLGWLQFFPLLKNRASKQRPDSTTDGHFS